MQVISKRDEELRPLRERHMEWEGEAPIQDRTQGIIHVYVITHNHKNHRTVSACYN